MLHLFSIVAGFVLIFNSAAYSATAAANSVTVLGWVSSFEVVSSELIDQQKRGLKVGLIAIREKYEKHGGFADLYFEMNLTEIEETLSTNTLTASELRVAIASLKQDKPPLEEPLFTKLRSTLRALLASLMSQDRTLENEYINHIEVLASYLGNAQPSFEDNIALRKSYAWLSESGQAAPLLKWWKIRFSAPNAKISLSAQIIKKLMKPMSLSETYPIDEITQQQGRRVEIRGQARSSGEAQLRLVPSRDSAQMELALSASVSANVTASMNVKNRAVDVDMFNRSQIMGGLPIRINPDMRLNIGELYLNISSNSIPQNARVQAKLRIIRAIGQKIAMNEAWKQKPATEKEAVLKIESQIRSKVNTIIEEKVNPNLVPIKKLIDNVLRLPLIRTETMPGVLLSTDEKSIQMNAWFSGFGRLGAEARPPEYNSDELSFQIHESVLNNVIQLLAGQSIPEDDLKAAIFGKLFEQPGEDIETGYTAVNLDFADENPVLLDVDDNEITLQINLNGINTGTGPRKYDVPAKLSARYDFHFENGQVFLERIGEPEVDAPTLSKNPRASRYMLPLATRLLVPRLNMKPLKFEFEIGKKTLKFSVNLNKASSQSLGWLNFSGRVDVNTED